MRIVSYDPDKVSKTKKFYVYTHTDPNGNVFYVGKGTGKRAWDKDRHDMWKRYIGKFNGKYSVDIVKDGLTEDEALDFEDDLMRRYGGQLVNWANTGLNRDYDLLDKYWALRNANEEILKQAKEIEDSSTDKAIEYYQQALTNMFVYETMNTDEEKKYTGLALEVYNEFCELMNRFESGKVEILDRLTICLKKANRQAEMSEAVTRYIEIFPSALCRAGMFKVIKRAKLNQSIDMLNEMIRWAEELHQEFNTGVHPWPYTELATLYRKQKAVENELSVLERFAKHSYYEGQEKASLKLHERLAELQQQA
ncbi:GIY-YIG nuclease family protein [Niallia taxi]|uniref:hypothetical protein n=1 Tax=Niallia taxi TaxID=2499688 RepID=UPI0015F714A9|nr:hypothetical protein [Niallia taxi]